MNCIRELSVVLRPRSEAAPIGLFETEHVGVVAHRSLQVGDPGDRIDHVDVGGYGLRWTEANASVREVSSRWRSTVGRMASEDNVLEGWSTVTPRMICTDTRALLGFLEHVFGAEGTYERDRPTVVRIGDSNLQR